MSLQTVYWTLACWKTQTGTFIYLALYYMHASEGFTHHRLSYMRLKAPRFSSFLKVKNAGQFKMIFTWIFCPDTHQKLLNVLLEEDDDPSSLLQHFTVCVNMNGPL